jgi:hypothetical protein
MEVVLVYQKFIRWTGAVWIAVLVIAGLVFATASLLSYSIAETIPVPEPQTTPAPAVEAMPAPIAEAKLSTAQEFLKIMIRYFTDIKFGEILQAFASLAGAGIGTYGAFWVARKTLAKSEELREREKQEHQFQLASLVLNASHRLRPWLFELSKHFPRLNDSPEEIAIFAAIWRQAERAKLIASPVLRNELITSYPYLENALHVIEVSEERFSQKLEECIACGADPNRAMRRIYCYRDAVVSLSDVAKNLVLLHAECFRAINFLPKRIPIDNELYKECEAIYAAVNELEERTASDKQVK